MWPKQWYGMQRPEPALIALLEQYGRPAKREQRAVDLGCGNGRHLPALAALGWEPVGIDLDPEMCRLARRTGFEVIECDVTRHWPIEGSVGLIVAWGFMMTTWAEPLVADSGAARIIASWRATENDFLHDKSTQRHEGGRCVIHNENSILNGLPYRVHDRSDLAFAGYDLLTVQHDERWQAGRHHAWWYTVHERRGGQARPLAATV
jgi:SAM-dependent methyltransferase